MENRFELIDVSDAEERKLRRVFRVEEGQPLTGHGEDNGRRIQVAFVKNGKTITFRELKDDDRYGKLYAETYKGEIVEF